MAVGTVRELKVRFDTTRESDQLIATFNQPITCALHERLGVEFARFSLTTKKDLRLSWDVERLISQYQEWYEEKRVLPAYELGLLFPPLTVAKQEALALIAAIKEKIVEVCIAFGLYDNRYDAVVVVRG